MTQRENPDADHCVHCFRSVMRKAESPRHDSKAKTADRARHHETMLENATPQSDGSKDHCERQAEFVNDRASQDPARRGKQREQDGGSQAMHKAQARKRHRYPVQARSGNRKQHVGK